jgi:hypothetical protein
MDKILRIFGVIQGGLVKLTLFLVYMFGFGVTYIFVFIFQRGLLQHIAKKEKSFWKETEGYEPDLKSAQEQS